VPPRLLLPNGCPKDIHLGSFTIDIADYFGVETGNKVNKIEKAGCHVHKSTHVNEPIIEEFPVTLECECISYSDETGILVGKIIAQQADEAVLKDGVVDYDKLQPNFRHFHQDLPTGGTSGW